MRRGCGAAILAFQKRGQIEYNRAVQLLFVAPSRIHALPRVLNPSPSCLRQMAWAGPLLLVLAAYLSSASAANDATTDAVSVRPRNAHPRPRNSTNASLNRRKLAAKPLQSSPQPQASCCTRRAKTCCLS